MKTVSIAVDSIEVGERHRALSDDAVERLAASIEAIGLRSPITIRVVNDYVLSDGEVCDGVPVLVAGRHRLAAYKKLGLSHIDCIDADDDAITAELWELAENLHRLDLTKEQRDAHLRRYVELIEQRRAIVAQNGEQLPRGPGRPISVIQEVADATGVSRETVRRAAKPPAPRELVDVVDPYDAVIAQADAIVRAWNKACPEARDLAASQIDGAL